jgi:hypothetical protein
MKRRLRMDGYVGVEVYKSGFDYSGHGGDMKVSKDTCVS